MKIIQMLFNGMETVLINFQFLVLVRFKNKHCAHIGRTRNSYGSPGSTFHHVTSFQTFKQLKRSHSRSPIGYFARITSTSSQIDCRSVRRWHIPINSRHFPLPSSPRRRRHVRLSSFNFSYFPLLIY